MPLVYLLAYLRCYLLDVLPMQAKISRLNSKATSNHYCPGEFLGHLPHAKLKPKNLEFAQTDPSKILLRKSNNLLLKTLSLSFSTLGFLLLACPVLQAETLKLAQIQIPVPPRTPTIPPLPSPPLLPPPEELLKPPQSPQTPTAPQENSNIPGTIEVKGFQVIGSTIFSKEKFNEILKDFIGKKSFADLLNARSAITKFYVDNGYVTSGAFIPPQTLEGGIVKIQVVEGSLEDIKISGTTRLDPNYIRSRIAVAAGKPLNVPRLLESLQLLQLDPLLKNISAELSAGSRPGVSLLEVTVAENKTFNVQLRTDNGRSPSVGSWRRGLTINENNFNGLGDNLSLSYTNTEGSNELDFNYRLPVNARNGTVNLGYTTSFSNIIERPFDAVDIESRSTNYEIGFRQPLIQSPTRELAVGISAVRRESETTLLGTPFPLSVGADDQGKTRVHALRLFQEYTQRSAREVFAARSQFSIGLDLFDSTINKNSPDGRFLAWRGQAQYLRLLAPDTTLLVRSDIQLTPDKLLPLEQFGLGGLDSVRGYRQDLLLSDNGILASAELRYPVYRVPQQGLVVQIVPFFDVGSAWNNSKNKIDPSNLFSVGVGLRLQQGDRFTARFDYGIPLVDTSTKARTWQENGLYFSVQYNLF